MEFRDQSPDYFIYRGRTTWFFSSKDPNLPTQAWTAPCVPSMSPNPGTTNCLDDPVGLGFGGLDDPKRVTCSFPLDGA